MVTQADHDRGVAEAERIRRSGQYAVAADYDASTRTIRVRLKSGMILSFQKERVQALADATDQQLSVAEISPAGWSVDFPLIDDGFTIEAILAGRFGNERWERQWAESHPELVAA